jgi:secreted trypsin-like serine protease
MNVKVLLCLVLITAIAADDASEFIIGGSDAALGQFPHMASIRYEIFRGSSETRHGCGGGVISSRWVLTVGESSNKSLSQIIIV